MTRKLEKSLDDLYRGQPADFTKGRDALAKELRSSGNEGEAGRVKALRKPSKAAAVLNALALEQPKPIKRYIGLAEKLRKASSGKVDATRMRSLAREEGELLEELVAEAGTLGDGASAPTLDRVRETLQAAQVDPELRDRVLAGRVEREERAASVGLDNLAAPPEAARRPKGKAKKRTGGAAKSKDAQKKRLAEAEVSEAKAAARQAVREIARAEAALTKAERTRDAAARSVEQAEAKLARLS